MAQIIPLNPLFERLSAREKKFPEVIVFVHHYGGHKHSFRKHMEFVNELGYDVVTFDLPLSNVSEVRPSALPISKSFKFGLRHVWADKIEEVLGHLPEKKILYSFSSASSAALAVIAKRSAVDIVAWICDGGPFMQPVQGFKNYLAKFSKLPLERAPFMHDLAARGLAYVVGSGGYEAEMRGCLSRLAGDSTHLKSDSTSLRHGFPILNFVSEKDVLATPTMIDELFTLAGGVSVPLARTRVSLPHSGHLSGFKDDGEIYRKNLESFLAHLRTIIR